MGRILILVIAVACFVAARFVRKNSDGIYHFCLRSFCNISGPLLILIFFIFLILDIGLGYRNSIPIIMFVMIGVGLAVFLKNAPLRLDPYTPVRFDELSERAAGIIKWSMFSLYIFPVFFMLHTARFPTVKLEEGVIHISGVYGGEFNISDIQTFGTVGATLRIGPTRSGNEMFAIYNGIYNLANEKNKVRMFVYNEKGPLIEIRMKDNSMLVFNFKKPDRTVAFYNEVKNALEIGRGGTEIER